MALSAKQIQTLRRDLDARHVRSRHADGRELSYLEGWFVISEANRIFGFDGWSRETVEIALCTCPGKPWDLPCRLHCQSAYYGECREATIVREGHGTGEGRGTSPGEVHDIALKAAETDATKRALATFGKPFGLELYRKDKISPLLNPAVVDQWPRSTDASTCWLSP